MRLCFRDSQQQPETLVWATTTCCRQTPDPLSMEDVCQQKRVAVRLFLRLNSCFVKIVLLFKMGYFVFVFVLFSL